MRIHVALSLILAFCWISLAIMSAEAEFDYTALVLEWPASYCYESSQGCCHPKYGKPALDFFISGLITSNHNTSTSYEYRHQVVATCNGRCFDIIEVADLESELFKYWSNVECPSKDPRVGWRRSWKSFADCSNGFSQHGYFKRALELRKQVNLLSTFQKQGIVPSGENLYSIQKIKKVIGKSLGESVSISCSKNMWDEWQLHQVYICLDKDASTIVSCPRSLSFTCGDQVTFGLFTYDMIVLAPTQNNNYIKCITRGCTRGCACPCLRIIWLNA